MAVPPSTEPPRNSWRAKERNVGGKGIETAERQMISMRMRQEERMKRWQTGDRNPRRTHPREKTAQPLPEVGVRQDPDARKVQQQCGVADVRDTQLRGRDVSVRRCACHLPSHARAAVWRARSLAISHCCGSAAIF